MLILPLESINILISSIENVSNINGNYFYIINAFLLNNILLLDDILLVCNAYCIKDKHKKLCLIDENLKVIDYCYTNGDITTISKNTIWLSSLDHSHLYNYIEVRKSWERNYYLWKS